MDANLLTALVSLAGSAIGTLGGIIATQKLTQYRIAQLEKKVDEYNNVKTRTTELETWRKAVDKEIKELKERISKLEALHLASF